MHADKTNRLVLILLAVLALAIGGLGAATGFDAFGHSWQHRGLLDNPVSRYFGTHSAWVWPVVAVAGAALTLLCLYWLSVLLFSTDRAGDLRLHHDRTAGVTRLAHNALTSAVVEEIGSYSGVSSARARLVGDPENPRLVIVGTLEETADLVTLRRRIEGEAITHARQALDNPELPVRLDLTVTNRRARRTA